MTVGSSTVYYPFYFYNTSSVTIHISQPVFTGAFSTTATCATTLAPMQGCGFEVGFNAPSAGNLAGTVSITSPEAGTLTSTLSGTGVAAAAPTATLTPTSQNFGSMTVGSGTVYYPFYYVNTSSVTIHISQPVFTGAFSTTATCATTLAPMQGCGFEVGFNAPSAGIFTGTLSITSPEAGTLSSTLSGTGVAAAAPTATLTPTSQNFGSMTVGSGTVYYPFYYINTSSVTIHISQPVFTGAFSTTATCATTLAPMQGCGFEVGFNAPTAGALTGTVSITSPEAGTLSSILSGTGIAAAAPTATLTPANQNFGSMTVGSGPVYYSFYYVNTSSVAIHISQPVFTGAFSTTATCATTLAPMQGCGFEVGFNAPSAGSFTGTLSITSPEAGTLSSTLSGTGVAAPPIDFTLTNPSGATLIVHRGFSANLVIDLGSSTATNPFTAPVTFSVSGLPAGVTAAFSPSILTPGSGAATTLTVTAAPVTGQNRRTSPLLPGEREAAFAISAALMVGLFGFRKRLNPRLLLFLCALGLLGGMVGCGSGSGFNVPTSTSNISVTATSGSISHTISVTLTVQ